jgi:hypothetical protein
MAKVIEFHIPASFRKLKKTRSRTRGQVIQFDRAAKKSA